MKILLYVRQAFALIKEDKQFSFIYIAGTAVAIASAMVVALAALMENTSAIRGIRPKRWRRCSASWNVPRW